MSRRAFFALIAGLIFWRPAPQADMAGVGKQFGLALARNFRDGLTDVQMDALVLRIRTRSAETVAHSIHDVRWLL